MSKPVKIFLIVIGVFALVIPVLLILATLAIPAMQQVNRRAHQTSAIASLRLLNQMEDQYRVTYPNRGFACSLATLGGDPQSGQPTVETAQLIPADLASGKKAGYTFSISNCTKSTVDRHEIFTTYQIVAVPDVVGRTGTNGFCTDETAEIKFDPKGGTNCTELLQ